MKERWPASPEENLKRLENAGLPMDRGIPKCNRCGEMGHMSRNCSQEYDARMIEKPEIKCFNCMLAPPCLLCSTNPNTGGETTHRVRDCPNERTFGQPRAPRECKICQSTEHLAKDCNQREVMKCRNCKPSAGC